MEKRQLGKTDLQVSKICLGTMTWGEQNTEAEAFEQLDYALDQGINFIDTAELYPVPPNAKTYSITETYIGNWFKARNNRNQVILASKIGGLGPDWIRDGKGFTPDSIITAVDDSLARLQTDTIDLYQLHWPQRMVPKWGRVNYTEEMFDSKAKDQIHETLKTLGEVVKAGKVRHVGLSNETAWGTHAFLDLAEQHGLPRMESIQNAYNLLRREYENSLAEISMQEKIGLLAYSPLAGGVLTGKYRNQQLPEESRMKLFPTMMGYYMNEGTVTTVEKLTQIAEEINISLTQLSLAFVNDRGFVTSNIIGATTMEQLKEDISSADITLCEETIDKINKVFKEHPNPATF